MRLILARMPALDAALIRFDAWWSGLTRRERWLVGGLAGLLAALILIFLVIKPLQAARAQALADIRTYETLNARTRAAGTLASAGATPRRQGPPLQIAQSSAASFGLTATAEPVAGGVRVAIADGTYDSMLAWLADLATTSSLRTRQVAIRPGGAPGRVSATVDFGA